MSNSNLPTEEQTQSFVIRLWQELPGKWRGTVRHVQSNRQRAVNSAKQATQFVERCTEAAVPQAVETSETARQSSANWFRLSPKFALALAAVLVIGLIGVALLNESPLTVTPGTATGDNNFILLLGVFVGGFVVGGGFIWFLKRDA